MSSIQKIQCSACGKPKTVFKSEARCLQAIDSFTSKSRSSLKPIPYWCDPCSGWHIGTDIRSVKRRSESRRKQRRRQEFAEIIRNGPPLLSLQEASAISNVAEPWVLAAVKSGYLRRGEDGFFQSGAIAAWFENGTPPNSGSGATA